MPLPAVTNGALRTDNHGPFLNTNTNAGQIDITFGGTIPINANGSGGNQTEDTETEIGWDFLQGFPFNPASIIQDQAETTTANVQHNTPGSLSVSLHHVVDIGSGSNSDPSSEDDSEANEASL